MNELKKCPFCGSEAIVIDLGMYEVSRHKVECKKCKAQTTSHIGRDSEAIAAWNRRANSE